MVRFKGAWCHVSTRPHLWDPPAWLLIRLQKVTCNGFQARVGPCHVTGVSGLESTNELLKPMGFQKLNEKNVVGGSYMLFPPGEPVHRFNQIHREVGDFKWCKKPWR